MKPSSFTPSCARTNFVSSRTTKYGLLMSDIVIYIRLDPYLAQWLRHEHFGSPIEFPKNSTEYDIIELGVYYDWSNKEGGSSPAIIIEE